MKILVLVIVLAVILVGLPIVVASDTSTSLTDSSIPDNEKMVSRTKASNSSASGTITITMYTTADD